MVEKNRQLSRSDILGILPQGPRFMFLENAEILEPGKSARGKLVRRDTPGFEYLEDHLPNAPVFPGVLFLELCADLLAVAAVSGNPATEGKIGILRGGEVKRLKRFIKPEDDITVEVEVQRILMGRGGKGVGKIIDQNGELIGETVVTFGLIDPQILK